jgi:ATP-dependent Zn protease
LAVRAAERIVYRHLSTGAAADLVKVTEIARVLVPPPRASYNDGVAATA